jgi:hypothetical protein
VSCEAEQVRVDSLQGQVSAKAAACASICAGNMYPDECAGCRSELDGLRSDLIQAQNDLAKCRAANPPPATSRLLETRGHVIFLLVNEQGSGYGGGSTNWIDADVVFKLDSRPDKGFGFQLRDDPALPVRQGMLDLLQNAIANNLQVITDYVEPVATPNNNCFVIRVALTQTPPSSGWPGGIPEAMA